MIDFGPFQFACPPAMHADRFIEAFSMAGLVVPPGAKWIEPHSVRSQDKLRVSVHRLPYQWLEDFFREYWNKTAPYEFMRKDGLLYRAVMAMPVRGPSSYPSRDFDRFLRQLYHHDHNVVGRIYAGYNADTYLSFEQFPDCAVELLNMIGIEDTTKIQARCLSIRTERLATEDQVRYLCNVEKGCIHQYY